MSLPDVTADNYNDFFLVKIFDVTANHLICLFSKNFLKYLLWSHKCYKADTLQKHNKNIILIDVAINTQGLKNLGIKP